MKIQTRKNSITFSIPYRRSVKLMWLKGYSRSFFCTTISSWHHPWIINRRIWIGPLFISIDKELTWNEKNIADKKLNK